MRAWPKKLRELVVRGHREGRSFPYLAAEFEVPVGTVKTWCRRSDMKPGMKPGSAKGKAGAMKPGMKPDGPVMYRGLTARDMPGRTRMEQQLNFSSFRRDAYPPRRWGIPGYLEGEALAAAMADACAKFRKQPRKNHEWQILTQGAQAVMTSERKAEMLQKAAGVVEAMGGAKA